MMRMLNDIERAASVIHGVSTAVSKGVLGLLNSQISNTRKYFIFISKIMIERFRLTTKPFYGSFLCCLPPNGEHADG